MAALCFGRSDWTRTSDLCVPNAAFYQAELHFDNASYLAQKKYKTTFFLIEMQVFLFYF